MAFEEQFRARFEGIASGEQPKANQKASGRRHTVLPERALAWPYTNKHALTLFISDGPAGISNVDIDESYLLFRGGTPRKR